MGEDGATPQAVHDAVVNALGADLAAINAATNAAAAAMEAFGATARKVHDAVIAALRAQPARAPSFPDDNRPGENKFLQKQLRSPEATLARIYSFSYEGQYYELPKPAIFLVHGEGRAIRVGPGGNTNIETSGVMTKIWEFSDDGEIRDLRYWEYDKGDFSIRLDIETGPFEQIVLAAQLRSASPTSGVDLRAGGDGVYRDPRRR